MFGLGFTEILVICVVALILFGPDKLPEIARTLGQSAAHFRRAMDEFRYELMSAPLEQQQRPPVLTPPSGSTAQNADASAILAKESQCEQQSSASSKQHVCSHCQAAIDEPAMSAADDSSQSEQDPKASS